MGFFPRIFGSGQKSEQKQPAQTPAATQSASTTDRLTFENAADFSAILKHCSAKENEGRIWPSANLLRQLRDLLREAPIQSAAPSSVSLTRQLPALWMGREDLKVTENLEFTRSLTGDFAAVIDEIMDKIGRAEKIGVFVSLHREPGLGVTVNCHVMEGVFSLLTVKLPANRFALYSCLQQAGNDAGARKALDLFLQMLSMPQKDFQKYLDADLEAIKANLQKFARAGKTMDFLAESFRKRASETGDTAAEVLVSEPAFAETFAKELATYYTYVRDQLGQGNDIRGETIAKELMNPEQVMNMGRAAHLLMRAIGRDPKLGNRAGIVDSLRRVEHSSDPFVSGNAVEALETIRRANQPPRPIPPGKPPAAAPKTTVAAPIKSESGMDPAARLTEDIEPEPKSDLTAVRAGVFNPDEQVRKTTVERLKSQGEVGVQALISVFVYPHSNLEEIRQFAREGGQAGAAQLKRVLIEIGSGVVPGLLAASEQYYKEYQSLPFPAVEVFAELRDTRALPLLRREYERQKPSAAGPHVFHTVAAIAKIEGAERAFDVLLEALKDEHGSGMAPYAAEALGKLGDVRAIPRLIAAAESPRFKSGKAEGENVPALNALVALIQKHPSALSTEQLRGLLSLPDRYSKWGPQQTYSSFRQAINEQIGLSSGR